MQKGLISPRINCFPALSLAVLLALLSPLAVRSAHAQTIQLAPPGDTPATAGPLAENLSAKFTHKDLAKAIKLVADWQLQRMPTEAQTDWTWAALYTGFMAVPPQVAGRKYRQAMMQLGDRLQWQPGPRVLHADDQAVGQTYLELYLLHKDARMLAPMRDRLDREIATPDDAAKQLWWWCDALFMAPPVYADMAAATGDSKYLAYMDHEWTITTDLLYDPDEHLYARDESYLTKREPNGKKIFWSRGEGWVMAGIARTLEYLPKDDPKRPFYINHLREMAARATDLQQPDGLWPSALLDPTDYPQPEISGSALMLYALTWGVNEHLLDAKMYRPIIAKAWRGVLHHVYADGRLGGIQQTGAEPAYYLPGSSYNYGVGGYLLAASELKRMSIKPRRTTRNSNKK